MHIHVHELFAQVIRVLVLRTALNMQYLHNIGLSTLRISMRAGNSIGPAAKMD